MRIEFEVPEHVVKDLKIIREYFKRTEGKDLTYMSMFIAMAKELRERIEFEKQNNH